MRNLFQKTGIVLTMALLSACDENMMGEGDASTPESCVLYVNPDAEVDAGSGESEASPLSSMDVVMSRAAALKSRCGDAAEVRIVGGALSNEQSGMATEALKSAGVKVRQYAQDVERSESIVLEAANGAALAVDKSLFESDADPLSKFPALSAGIDEIQDMTSRASGSCTDYYVVTGTNPYYKLDSNSATYVDWVFATDDGNLEIRRSAASGSGTTGERIVFRANADPSSAVDISGFENDGSGSGNGILRLYKGSTTSTPMVMDNNEIDSYDSAGLYLNNNSTQPIYLSGNNHKTDGKYDHSNYVYMVRNDGRVGIGNLSKSQITHKLTVDGGIKAEEIVVDAVGADFVFEDDYDLMSLDEVSSFVEDNRHLPGIASADEMRNNGLPMGEFQIKLLQKVEELTLYAIEQNERTKRLEEENSRLNAMLHNILGTTK